MDPVPSTSEASIAINSQCVPRAPRYATVNIPVVQREMEIEVAGPSSLSIEPALNIPTPSTLNLAIPCGSGKARKIRRQQRNDEPQLFTMSVFNGDENVDDIPDDASSDDASPSTSQVISTVKFEVQPAHRDPKYYRQHHRFRMAPTGKLYLAPEDDDPFSHISDPAEKRVMIIKAAKALFAKRTATLCHWTYPNATKDQTRSFIDAHWNRMEDPEKHVYVQQVTGRFVQSKSNLMVNPLLSHIREFPQAIPVADPKPAGEVHNAIESIMQEGDAVNMRASKRRNLSKNGAAKKHARRDEVEETIELELDHNLCDGFEDDSELTKELEMFAMNNMNMFCDDDEL